VNSKIGWLVDLRSTNRRGGSWLAFAFMGLALCVVIWGVQYKLSVYDPPQSVSHQIPQAKLLSREQRATADEGFLIDNREASAPVMYALADSVLLVVFLASNLLSVPASSQTQREKDCPWRLRCRAGMNTFFFRPPPTLA
jgi:hypothetical protein